MKSPILGGSYVARSTNAADARLVNLYAEATEDNGKEAGFLSRCPGLRLLATVGSGPIRGLWTFGEYAYVVSGLELYRMSKNYGNSLLGSVTGTGPVSMSDNGTQLFIACDGPGFIYNSSTNAFSVINDPDYAGAVSVGFIDGYFVFTQPDSQIFWVTTLYDGSSVDPLDFASAEGSPDGIVSMIVDHREVWLFGTNSVEVWYDAGNTDFPLARIQGAYNEVGCAATFSVAKLDNGIFWLGSDSRGNGIVYRSKGYSAVRVSTSAIEYAIQNYNIISDAVAYTYQQQGHTFYVLTFPSADATWVYDASTDLWHERAGWGPNGFMRHRSNCQMNFNNEIIVGDYQNGKIYAFDLDNYTDDGEIQKWLRSWRAIPTGQNNLKRSAQHSVQLDMEVGAFNTLTEQIPSNNEATLDVTLASIAVDMIAGGGGDILFAPFTSTTTTTDVISPALTPTVTSPSGTSLTFDATKGTFNTTSNTGSYPSVKYGNLTATTKISPASYPADSMVFSAYINLTGVANGTGTPSGNTELIRLDYQGSGGFWNITYGVYVNISTLTSYQDSPDIGSASQFLTTSSGPSAGVHKYSIEWMPNNTLVWRLDSQIVRVTQGSIRPTADFGCTIQTNAQGYASSTGGVYEYTLRDFLYQHAAPTSVYAFINTFAGYVFSNNCKTFTYPWDAYANCTTTVELSGKVYCEFACTAAASLIMYQAFGVHVYPPSQFNNAQSGGFIYCRPSDGDAGTTLNGTGTNNSAYQFTTGDRIGIAFDATTKKIWFSKNGIFIAGDPAAGTSASVTLTTGSTFYFQTSSLNGGGLPSGGTYTHVMYPKASEMLYSPPTGFSRYDPS